MTATGGPAGRIPSYAELAARTDAPPGSAWGLFGPDDTLGTLNHLTPERVRDAARLAVRGAVFGLDYEVGAFSPPTSPGRESARHTVLYRYDGRVLDDKLDDFYLQVSSQIDGLRHHRHAVHGFYNGVSDDAVADGTPALGIQTAAAAGIVGRGVLLDVGRQLAREGRPLDLDRAETIGVDVLDRTAAAQGTQLRDGDILLIHTGWARHVLHDLSDEQRRTLPVNRRFCGLEQSHETLAWIWDHRFAMVASDTVAVEAIPSAPTSPFTDNVNGMMHPDLIALLGVHLGELWKLDDLAADCAADGVHEFLLTAKPLNVTGGVGSPPNAMAVK